MVGKHSDTPNLGKPMAEVPEIPSYLPRKFTLYKYFKIPRTNELSNELHTFGDVSG
jgi:hypothetical protein